jgi:hypothetical protein
MGDVTLLTTVVASDAARPSATATVSTAITAAVSLESVAASGVSAGRARLSAVVADVTLLAAVVARHAAHVSRLRAVDGPVACLVAVSACDWLLTVAREVTRLIAIVTLDFTASLYINNSHSIPLSLIYWIMARVSYIFRYLSPG